MKISNFNQKKHWLLIGFGSISILITVLEVSRHFLVPQPPQESPLTADQLYQQGLENFNAEHLPAAIELWERALSLYRAIENRHGESNVLYEIGFSYYWLADYEKAIAAYQASLVIAEELENQHRQATLWNYLADVYFYQKNYVQAIEACQRSIPIAQQIEDHQRQWFSTHRLAEVYFAQKNYIQAKSYYQKSLKLAQQLNDTQLQRFSLSGLGLSDVRLENYFTAFKTLQEELELSRKLGDAGQQADSLHLLGFVAYWLNDYGKAIAYYEQSLILSQKGNFPRTEQLTLSGLGDTYFFLGDYARAFSYHQQSLFLAQKLGDQSAELTLLNALGGDYFFLDSLSHATDTYNRVLSLARTSQNIESEGNTVGNAFAGLGQAYFSQENYPQALIAFERSLAIFQKQGNRYNEGATFSNLGNVYLAQQDYPKAIAAFQQRLAISQRIQENYGKAQALGELGLVFFKSGNLDEAEKNLRASIDLSESFRKKLGNQDSLKISLFDTQSSPYRILQEVLVARNQCEAALEIAERGRARSFAELLAQKLTINASLPSINSVTLTFPTLAEIRRIVQEENATVVEYSIIPESSKLYIWVIKPTSHISFRQVDLECLPESNLTVLVSELRSVIGARGRGGSLEVVTTAKPSLPEELPLARLYQVLIEPIIDLLPIDPDEQVIFVPQGALLYVPFSALTDSAGRAFIDKHTLRTIPAIQILDLTEQLARTHERLPIHPKNLIVGNPTLSSQLKSPPYELETLPYAEQEAKAIAALLNTRPWLGSQATKTDLLIQFPEANLIHMATHGLLDDFREGGVPGAIALAPAGDDNGLLTANDILNLKLKADLVVLSACDTGRGKITGDGVIGLSRSLITAGAPSVLVSLWSIPDAPTAYLMTEFYRSLQSGRDKAQALRQAMLATKQQYSDPLSWAAFTLIGEAE